MDAVTVTYNSRSDLKNLLECEPMRAAFDRIVVVDAGSTDGSGEMAESLGATLVRMPARSGYGSSVNAGADLTRGDAFAVLNPDILLDDAEIPFRLEQLLLESEDTGIVAPSLRLPDGSLQDSARSFPTPMNLITRRRSAQKLGAIHDSGPVPWVVGAFMIIKRDAFAQIDGFDESYFLYFEDVDLCWRMRQAGYKSVLVPSEIVRHDHQGASRAPIWNSRTRTHIRSAARFYTQNPRFVLSSSAR